MKSLIFLAGLVLAINANPDRVSGVEEISVKTQWEEFKLTYSKSYKTTEEYTRFKIFSRNLVAISKHNSEEALGQHTYKQGINQFTDMDLSEVIEQRTGFSSSMDEHTKGVKYLSPVGLGVLPTTVDWVKKGYVTPVRDQGKCNSCYAFSSIGSTEGQNKRSTGKLVELSKQNIVDCSQSYGNTGCTIGGVLKSYKYIIGEGGINSEASYKYTGVVGKCLFNPSAIAATLSSYVKVAKGDEDKLKEAVATIGPISIGADISQKSFKEYTTGVYVEAKCTTVVNHAMLCVGYGTENGKDYWLIKNSWGAAWGANGYIKMARNLNNQCGIASSATYPLV